MAQKAKKELAKANTSTLNNLHVATLTVHALFWLWRLLFAARSVWAYAILSLPSLLCEYVLESTGRPKYDAATRALKSSGDDMAAAGLTEYMFDVVWVTWASIVLVVLFGNWAWWLMAVVPVYAIYIGSGLLGMGRQKMAQMQDPQGPQGPQQGNRKMRRAA